MSLAWARFFWYFQTLYNNIFFGTNMPFKLLPPASIKKILWAIFFFFIVLPDSLGMEIIVNKSVPVKQYTMNELRSIFAMQQHIWSNEEKIHVFVLADDNPLHRQFTKTKLNMFPHQFRRIWDRLIFSGTGQAPRQVFSPEEMIEKIITTPNSIGYSGVIPENDSIRILKYE